MTKLSIPIIIAVVSLLLSIGAIRAMPFIPKLPLLGAWKERFQDVQKLNAYAKINLVELSNVKIEKYRIDGTILHGGKFENTDWSEVSVKNAQFTKVTFRGGVLDAVDFSDSTLTDVVFEDVKLIEVRFLGPTLKNVRFVRCELDAVNIDRTKNSSIEVIDSKVENSSLSRGELIAVFRNSKLFDGTRLTSLMRPSSLTFEKSELDGVIMDRSQLKELIINDTKFNSALEVGSTDTISIRNSTIDTTFSATTIGNISVDNTAIESLSLVRSKIGTMSLTNCNQWVQNLGLYQASIQSLDISRCSLDDFRPTETIAGALRIKDSAISNSEFQKMKAKTLILDTVTLSGTLNFTNTQVTDLQTKNITQQPGLKLITTGSNVKF